MELNKHTVYHNHVKESIVKKLDALINGAVADDPDFQNYLRNQEAKTQKQIDKATIDFLGMNDYVGGFVFYSENGHYNAGPSLFQNAVMRNKIKMEWKNGKSEAPGTYGQAARLHNGISKNMQEGVLLKRKQVFGTEGEREKFLNLLQKIDHNDPLYLCRKFILSTKNVPGIHLPASEQKVVFTPYSKENPKPPTPAKAHPTPEPVKTKVQPTPAPTSPNTGFQIISYSDRAIAVLGPTKPLRRQFIGIYGSYNRNLNINGQKTEGWIFSKKREEQVKQLIAS